MTEPETSESRKHLKTAGRLPGVVEWKLALARLALVQERLWPRLWPLIILVLIFAAVSFFDLWRMVPGWAHAIGLAATASAGAVCLYHAVTGWRLPSRRDGLARLERDSDLGSRPLRGLTDTLALGAGDTDSQALWQAHQLRQRNALAQVRVRPPAANVPRADPYALRVAAAATALVGFLYAGPEWRERFNAGLSPDLSSANTAQAIIDAWITPPDYVRGAPIFLTHNAGPGDLKMIEVPEGSVLTVRASGLKRAPALRRTLADRTSASGDWRVSLAFEEEAPASYKIEMPIEASATLDVMAGRETLARWPVQLVADRAPAIAFSRPPEANERGQLDLAFAAEDDHGLASVIAEFTLADTEDADLGNSVLEPGEPQTAPLHLKGTLPKSVKEEISVDLGSHPWAGHAVDLKLIATDQTGRTGESAVKRLVLPQRPFGDPLAQAIVEQRAAIATNVEDAVGQVLSALDALTMAPERFMPDTTLYLGLRVTYHRLTGLLDRDGVRSAHDLMWNLALRAEDGDLSLAQQRVREAQQALARALENGAPDEEVEALTQDLRDALNDFMNALAETLQQAIERGDYAAIPEGAEALSAQDLDQMLDAIEQMSRSGAREAARDLLAQMQGFMDRLQLGAGPRQLTEEQSAMADALSGLGNIVEEQRALMDETFRNSQSAAGPSETDRSTSELARDQAELRERLEQLLGMMEGAGVPPNGDLERGAEAMGRAQDHLSADGPADALADQNEALARLQQGMSDLSERLGQSLGPGFSVGQSGRNGRDPLGRRSGRGSPDDGTVKVPDEGALQRAREILEDIKRRASDPKREREELDYLERLVPRF